MVAKRVTKKASEPESQLVDYEMVYILSPEIEDEKLNTTIENISQFIAGKGGAVSQVDRWGKRRLAYPIKHFLEGNYVLARFKLKPALSKELEAKLRISDEVLRHLLVKLDS